jgi:hypothetical protein
MSYIVYIVNYNSTTPISCLLALTMYKYNELKVSNVIQNWVVRLVIKHPFFHSAQHWKLLFPNEIKQWAQKSKRAKNENWKGDAFWVANLSMSRIIMCNLSYTNYSTQWVWQDTTKFFQVYKVMSKWKNKKTQILKTCGR